MRRRLIALIAFCVSLLSSPAFSADIPKANQQELRAYFGTLAGSVGCAKLVEHESTTVNLSELSFIPADDTPSHWSKLFTATVQMLPDDRKLALAAMHSYTSSMMQGLTQHARIEEITRNESQDRNPVIYLEYVQRRGLARVHGVGVYGRHTDTMAAYTRYEVRGRNLRDDEIAPMKNLAATLAGR